MWQRTAFLSKLIGLFCVLYSLSMFAPAGAAAYLLAMHYEQLFYIYASVTLALGAYLTYGGFNMKGNLNAQGGR